nr:unnamed protein product [Digitaria exilis]
MLDAYDFRGDVWFCHSFGGRCLPFTAYVPAIAVLRDLEAFLAANPDEVVTVFLEDYAAPGSLSNVFNAAGLSRYWFPVERMPTRPGQEWPLLQDMIARNHRLLGLVDGRCPRRAESKPMDSPAQSLVLMNFFTSNPSQSWACGNNSAPLLSRLSTCHRAAANRWPNYIAVDFYMRSTGGGAPLATDVANGRLHCGCDNIAHCKPNSSSCAAAAAKQPPAATSISLPPGPAPAPAPWAH